MKNIKLKIFKIINDDEKSALSKSFYGLIFALILINVIFTIFDTMSLTDSYQKISSLVEKVSVCIFTLEYLIRLWCSDLIKPNEKHYIARLRYIITPMAIVDLLAILPFYIPFILPVDLRVLRVLRIIRLLRIFKINRYTNALSAVAKVLKNKSSQLISSTFVIATLILISSILIYNFENPAQPEVFKNAFSGMWWAVATFTTVGYGDIYPITVGGKIFSAVMALLAIGLVAVPTGIISSGFIEEIQFSKKEDKKNHYCPNCGTKLD